MLDTPADRIAALAARPEIAVHLAVVDEFGARRPGSVHVSLW